MYQGIMLPDSSLLEDLKLEHLRTLSAPLDAYWEEALTGFADHYEIRMDGTRVGFYCLNSDKQLVVFHLSQEYANHGGIVLSYIIDEHSVSGALAGTNDSYFLSLCLDIATRSQVHTLLFQDNRKISDEFTEMDQFSFDLASKNDLADIFDHYCASSGSIDLDSVETGYENLKGYIHSVMDKHHIFVLREDGKLIATSECRISRTQKSLMPI